MTVFIFGFGALVAFRALGTSPAGLPGPFDFASVTWGDSLALPTMTGFFAYAVSTLPPARGDALFAAGAALLGGTLGVASQLAWLSNDAPRPNWTLPRAHHFTAAGWYHAAFVAVLSTAVAALLAVALNRVTAAAGPHRGWSPIAAGAAAGLAFIALLTADTRAHTTPDATGTGVLGTLIGLAAAALAATALATRRRPR